MEHQLGTDGRHLTIARAACASRAKNRSQTMSSCLVGVTLIGCIAWRQSCLSVTRARLQRQQPAVRPPLWPCLARRRRLVHHALQAQYVIIRSSWSLMMPRSPLTPLRSPTSTIRSSVTSSAEPASSGVLCRQRVPGTRSAIPGKVGERSENV